MRLASRTALAVSICSTIGAFGLTACGGNRPAEPSATTVAAEPASPPPVEPAAKSAPPAEASPAPPSAPKPARKVAQTSAPETSPDQAPKPAPVPIPAPVAKTVAAGTDLEVELLNGASSKTSQVGSTVRARVTRSIVVDGLTVVPEGAIVNGTVTEAVPLKKIGGAASLGLRFDTLELQDGTRAAIAAGLHEVGKSETGKDAGTIAGATAGGALLGRLLSKHDKTKGTLIGAAVGAAAGTGAAAATKGSEVELPAGTPLALHLEQPVTITVQP